MEYYQMTLDDWVSMKERLKKDLVGVQESFVRIGFTLRQIEDKELYKNDGYATIAEFARAEYGLGASAVSRFISINKKYSINGYSDRLRPEFANLGSSKLSEMLALPDSDMEMIRPETTRENIRELKQFNKNEPERGEADEIHQLIEKFYHDNKNILNGVFSSEAYITGNVQELIEVVNPGGNKMYRKGFFVMMMYEDNIKIKKFGNQPETLTWADFFVMTQEIFGSCAAGTGTYDNYFKDKTPETLENTECGEVSEKTKNTPIQQEKSADLPWKADENHQKDAGKSKNDTGPETQKEENAQSGMKKDMENTMKPAETLNGNGILHVKQEERDKEPENDDKTEIAPAQKSVEPAEILNKDGNLKNEEEPQINNENSFMNAPEKSISRKDYLDTLTEYGAADYISGLIKNLDDLSYVKEAGWWEKWLMQQVDKTGEVIEDERTDVSET